ncbi:adenosylcobinamide-phosphate synthase [Alteromonas sp. 345S023]|uniref:Adenosylcobinamide-phosphate synthase n=1 Tax=Alteromonas profundi TaxID=2696062 RepID=A0A7X5LJ70_9ALTE|nr:cobalamin biosynthesis protein [Alteromonas profundi]NDV90283.1 adenosylcobinamide-phosphate synthase [Alteromonas profundi]
MEAFFTDSAYQTLLVLWLAVAADALWQWPISSHPLTLMRYIVKQMGEKVLPEMHYPKGQHYISGTLAAVVLLSPIVTCVAILVYMAEYPVFFEAVIMIVVIDFGFQRRQFSKLLTIIGKNKKVRTRETLSTIVARDCSRLTDVGVAKAAIESLWLKFLYLYCGVIFYFVITGPVGALIYRLLLLMSWQWHYRTPAMRHFAAPIRKLVSLLVLPPAIVGALATLMVSHPIRGVNAMKKSSAKDKTSLLLALLGGVNDIQLGGPAIYHHKKYRYPRVGTTKQVKYSDIIRARRTIISAMCIVVALASIGLLLVAVSTQNINEFI